MSVCVCLGVHCVQQMQWLPCQFTDEQVSRNQEGHFDTQLIHRQATLQFGQKGDAPLNPHTITFLITGNILRSVVGQDDGTKNC